MPAKNAPSANDTPNSSADPNATPIAIASTASVNSSREPVPAMRSSIHGMALRPTTSMSDPATYADAGAIADLGRQQMQLRGELEEAEAQLLGLYDAA